MFDNKKVIVTGANRSIGKQIATEFSRQGADVVISYRSDKAGAIHTQSEMQKYGDQSAILYADFSSMDGVKAFADEAIKILGGVDILVNNAAMLCRETLFELAAEKMQQVFQVNTIAPLYLTQLCSQKMIEDDIKGSIINISSIAASMTMPKGVGYAASKAAVNKWTQNAALNLAEHGIRINTIAPGVIHSGMNERTAEDHPDLWEYYSTAIPLKRMGLPQDIANMAVYLASNKAEWITGKIFEVDGGHVL